MSQEETRQRWARYNLLGTGKNRSAFDTIWYRGDTMFLRDRPGARIVQYAGKFIVLNNGGVGSGEGTGVDRQQSERLFHVTHHVTCIGVFSRYEGDCMQLPQLHDRTNFLYNREFAERVRDYELDNAADYASNPQYWVNLKMSMLHTLDDRRLKYADTFDLDWHSYDPERFRPEIAEYYIVGAEKFNHPAAAAKRERAAARRTAKKAFGVA